MTASSSEVVYPTLLWREGYTYLAADRLELCAHPRSMFSETIQRARTGEWQLVDARGRCFRVADFSKIPPFGGLKGIGMRLLRSVFAEPVLVEEVQLALPDFKKKLASAIRSRYRYDRDKTLAGQVLRELKSANSYESAIAALPKL